MAMAPQLDPGRSIEAESAGLVFDLIDWQGSGEITQPALAQALLQSGLLMGADREDRARALAAQAAERASKIDKVVFLDALSMALDEGKQAVESRRAQDGSSSASALGRVNTASAPLPPTLGSALCGICDDVRKFYANEREDYRLAADAQALSENLRRREEMTRMSGIAMRQESEHQGVQEAQMMQAMEFNSAWSQNMTEFERQAREIEEGAIRRHQEEFDAFRMKMYGKGDMSYKYSRDLLSLKASVAAHAKMGDYNGASRIKKRADALDKFEKMKLENLHATSVATKELQLRQQQQMQLEALRRRIQRGREEHKEHWLMGAQRLMQSHRNMLSDLKSKQGLENMRAGVNVKLEMQSANAAQTQYKIKTNFSSTLPRVDTGKRMGVRPATSQRLGSTA